MKNEEMLAELRLTLWLWFSIVMYNLTEGKEAQWFWGGMIVIAVILFVLKWFLEVWLRREKAKYKALTGKDWEDRR